MSKKQHHEEHVDETWLIPYADMLTLLLALFIVMFAMGQTDKQKFEAVSRQFQTLFSGGIGVFDKDLNKITIVPDDTNYAGESKEDKDKDEKSDATKKAEMNQRKMVEEDNMKEIKRILQDKIKEEGYQDKVTIVLSKDALEISIQEKILFESGEAIVKKELSSILVILRKALATVNNIVKIVGHTDSIPIKNDKFRSNWDLSVIRAVNVMHAIVDNSGLEAKRFTVQGNAEFQQKADNSTELGRQQNRRVEIFIMRNHPLNEYTTN